MKCYEALADALVAEGTEVVFGLIGGEVAYLAQAMVDRHKVRFIGVRHEELAVSMADGYSRATGRIGVAVVCLGPGITNAVSSMVGAWKAQSQVLVICGGSPDERNARLPGQPMHIDEPPLLRAAIGTVRECRAPKYLSEDVALAFRHLRLRQGPIALQFQEDVAMEEMAGGWTYEPAGRSTVLPRQAGAVRGDVEKVVTMLRAASRPLVLAGRGAYRAGAGGELRALAAKSGALLATSLYARDWFRDDPFSVGVSGGFSPEDAAAILEQVDLVVAFGASLNNSTLRHGTLYRNAKIIQIDVDPEALNDINPVDVGIVADAKQMAQAILLSMDQIDRPDWRGPAMSQRIGRIDRWRNRDRSERTGTANPRAVVDLCDQLLPRNRMVVIDIGLFMGIPGAYMTVPEPDAVIYPWQFGRMGTGLGVAMGAAIGRPDRLAVAFLGDGGMMASMHAVDTIAEHRIPIMVVVMDDGGFGAERRAFENHKQGENTANYRVADLPAIARAFGLDGYRVTNSAGIRSIARKPDIARRSSFVQVIVDRSIDPIEMKLAGWA